MTGNVRITKGMLKQTKVALRAAQVVDTSSAVIDILNTVNAISANALPGDIEQDLPAGTSEILDVAISESVAAGSTDTTAINQVVYSDGSSNTGPDPVPAAGGYSPAGLTETTETDTVGGGPLEDYPQRMSCAGCVAWPGSNDRSRIACSISIET